MAAETGSGKTGAFCLPVLQIVWETRRDIQSGKLRPATGKGAKRGTTGVHRCTHMNYCQVTSAFR
jgi:ATP-dependent RNA helicase DDX1